MPVQPRTAEHDAAKAVMIVKVGNLLQPQAAGVHMKRSCEIRHGSGNAQVRKHSAAPVGLFSGVRSLSLSLNRLDICPLELTSLPLPLRLCA